MTSPRLIKKYANRRLYDTVESRHVTLSDLREMIVSGMDLRIMDDTSGDDITRALLLQIIVDREQAGEPLLTEVLLAQLIRFHGNPMQGMMADYLQTSVGLFLDQQKGVQTRFQSVLSTTPADTLRQLMKTNAAAWESMMGYGPDEPAQEAAQEASNTASHGADGEARSTARDPEAAESLSSKPGTTKVAATKRAATTSGATVSDATKSGATESGATKGSTTTGTHEPEAAVSTSEPKGASSKAGAPRVAATSDSATSAPKVRSRAGSGNGASGGDASGAGSSSIDASDADISDNERACSARSKTNRR